MSSKTIDTLHVDVAYITIPGDSQAGIPERTITVSGLGVDLLCFAEEDRAGYLAKVRAHLAELGELIDASTARVLFDFECQDAADVTCKFCQEPCVSTDAHLHQGEWVGECCWDERLRVTE